MRITRQRTFTYIGAVLMCGVFLAGCGGGGDDAQSSADGGAANPAAAPAAPNEAGGAGKDQNAKAPDLRVDQRAIVYTGSITVRVKDVNVAAARAIGFAGAAGGFVGSDNRNSGSGSDDASLTLRVPADKFAAVVDQLAGLGDEETRGISTEDVTEETVDLDARITVQQARVDSGRRLLANAKTLNDLVMLENEVATRESDLASLQAKKRRLADLTALSTITVVLLDPDAELAAGDDGPPGFLAGLKGGWDALLASLAVLVTVLGAILPWLVAFGLPIWGLIWLYRRFGRRRRPAVVPPIPAYAGLTPSPPAPAGSRPTSSFPAPSQPPASSRPASSFPAPSQPPAGSRPTSASPTGSRPASGSPAPAAPTQPDAGQAPESWPENGPDEKP